jgi:hypothetical protein
MFHPSKLSRPEALDVSNGEHSGATLVQLHHFSKPIIFNFAKVASSQNSDRIIGSQFRNKTMLDNTTHQLKLHLQSSE